MAKLRDQMMTIAEHREAHAEIAVPTCIKEFAMWVGGIKELRNDRGQVYKVVGLLHGRAVVAGRLEPIESEIELAAGANFGVTGEIEYCLKPALAQFADHVNKTFVAGLKEKDKPLDPDALPPLRSDRPPSEVAQERARRLHASNQTKAEKEEVPNG